MPCRVLGKHGAGDIQQSQQKDPGRHGTPASQPTWANMTAPRADEPLTRGAFERNMRSPRNIATSAVKLGILIAKLLSPFWLVCLGPGCMRRQLVTNSGNSP